MSVVGHINCIDRRPHHRRVPPRRPPPHRPRRRRRHHFNSPPHSSPFFVLSLLLLVIPRALASSAAGHETLIGVAGRDFVVLGADSSSGGAGGLSLTSSDEDKIRVVVDPTPLPPWRRGAEEEDEDDGSCGDGGMAGSTTAAANVQRCVAAAAAGDPADVDRIVGILSAHAAAAEYGAGVGRDVEFVVHRPGGGGGGSGTTPPPPPGGLDAEGVAHLARAEISSRLRTAEPLRVCLLVAGVVEVGVGSGAGVVEGGGGAKRAGGIVEGPAGANDDGEVEDGGATTSTSPFSRRIREQVEAATREVGGLDVRNGERAEEPTSSAPTGTTGQVGQRGVRSTLEPRLLWLDEYGSLQRLDYGAHGYGANFALSILDRGYRRGMSRGEAVDLVRDCFDQLRGRYVVNSPEPPRIKCVDARGCAPVVVARG